MHPDTAHQNNHNNNHKNKEKIKNKKRHKTEESASRPSSPSSSKNPPSNKRVSHSLSWALRHAAVDIGLTIQEDGYVPVQEILASNHSKLRGITLEQIQQVVETNDKQRFKLEERPRHLYYPMQESNTDVDNSTILCIRANQGHSIRNIDPEKLLTRLSSEEIRAFPCIVHGTYPEAWTSIRTTGLKKMNRTHIHFASGLPKDGFTDIISGMRKSCTVHIFLDTSKCADDDSLQFFTSDNGVILTDGVEHSGTLPSLYFSHVTDSSGNILMDNRGKGMQ
jgi:2'-phosphotransferase